MFILNGCLMEPRKGCQIPWSLNYRCDMGAGNLIPVVCKSSKDSELLSHLSCSFVPTLLSIKVFVTATKTAPLDKADISFCIPRESLPAAP